MFSFLKGLLTLSACAESYSTQLGLSVILSVRGTAVPGDDRRPRIQSQLMTRRPSSLQCLIRADCRLKASISSRSKLCRLILNNASLCSQTLLTTITNYPNSGPSPQLASTLTRDPCTDSSSPLHARSIIHIR